MKRLLTYLGLLATLLAMPYHAKADNMYLRFHNGTEKVVEMNHDGGNTAWHYDFYTTDDYWKNNRTIYVYPKVNNSISLKSPNSANQGTNVSGAEYEYWIAGGNNIYDYKITLPTDYATKKYKVTVWVTNYNKNSSDPYCKVKVTWERAEFNLQLKSDLDSWTGTPSESSTGYTWTWDKSKLSSISSGTQIKFKLWDEDEKKWYGVDGDTETQATSSWQSCVEGGKNWYVTYTKGNTYTIDAQRVNGTWQVKVTTNEEPHDYYWVSPQITNGEMWPAFKMVASRNRNMDGGGEGASDGKISTKYYTFTIKNEDLVTWKTKSKIKDDGNTTIQWYIVRDDGGLAFRPENDDPSTIQESTSLTCGNVTDNAVGYRNFMGYKDEGATRTGYFEFNKGYNNTSNSKKALAYTFIINNEKGNVFFNYAHEPASTSINYDLVGNFSNAKGDVAIDLSKPEFRKDLTKYWYKDGVGSTSYVAESDSIVYKVEVQKPANGWGDLYIDVIPDGSKDWAQALRPLISLGNNLDGRALHGALTTAKSEQSLNPEPSSNYLGYTFSFNATTRTYRLEFHTPDATLKPGTEDGNVDFKGSVSEDIAVALTDGSDGIHTEATQYAIGFGANANFDLSETNKYTDTKFNLSFDGNTITYTSADNKYAGTVSGNSIYVKVRGFDSTGQNYGDIHTYKYTFHSKIGFEPHGGLFINSAKIKISGGVPPYKYEIWHYSPKTENGEKVIDYTTGTLRSSGKFSNTAYNADDDNFRISTPGFLKIIDANNDYVSFEEVGGGFDFTYSTSENYKRNTTGAAITDVDPNNAGAYPNGADYWLAAPGDLTRLLSPTWYLKGSTDTKTADNVQPSWNGKDDNTILLNTGNEIYQTVTGLTEGTYTVQAIVRGEVADISLKLDDNVVNTITLTGDGSGSIASINPYGRCEHLENMQESTSNRAWHKLEGSADVTAGGSLKIAILADGRAYVDDVILLKDANDEQKNGFRTTASKSPTDIARYDFRRRQVSGQPSQRQNNAYSFFDRGKNQNAVIFANNKTVISMDKSLLAPECPNRDIDRRHPFNVVGTTEQDADQGTAKALYLTDAGYDPSDDNYLPIGYVNSSKGNNSDAYRAHGYTFCPGLQFYAEDLIFDRDMSQMAVKKTTCMLPVAFTPAQLKAYYGDNLKVYKWTSTSGNNLTFEQQDNNTALNANEPYIFWGAEGSLDTRGKTAGKTDGKFTIGAITYTDHNAASNHSGFPGTYAYKKLKRYGDASGAETDNINEAKETRFIYSAANGVFSVVSKNGANLKPFRAYFVIGVTDAAAEARQLNIFFDDSIITGVDSVETTAPTSGDIYTIGGVLVAKDGNMSGLPKGIYIMNGKKYVVK